MSFAELAIVKQPVICEVCWVTREFSDGALAVKAGEITVACVSICCAEIFLKALLDSPAGTAIPKVLQLARSRMAARN